MVNRPNNSNFDRVQQKERDGKPLVICLCFSSMLIDLKRHLLISKNKKKQQRHITKTAKIQSARRLSVSFFLDISLSASVRTMSDQWRFKVLLTYKTKVQNHFFFLNIYSSSTKKVTFSTK